MFSFCNRNSLSVVQNLQKDCLATSKIFVFAYGCLSHAIHTNLCMLDLVKHFPGVTLVLKHILFMVSNMLKASHLLLQLFLNKLCLKKYKKQTCSFYWQRQCGELCSIILLSKQQHSRRHVLCCLRGFEWGSWQRHYACARSCNNLSQIRLIIGWASPQSVSALHTSNNKEKNYFLLVYASFIAMQYWLRKLNCANCNIKECLNLGDNYIASELQVNLEKSSCDLGKHL